MPGRPIVPRNRRNPNKGRNNNMQNRKQAKPRPIVLQRIKGFEANLMLFPQVFRRSGIAGCVEVLRSAIPELQRKINEEVAKGASLEGCNWRAVFIEKAAVEIRKAGANEAQVADFKKAAWQAIS